MVTLLNAALALASRGMHIFPCVPRDKRPATPNGLKDATTKVEVISAWWNSMPEANIAVATGKASGIFVVDIDDEDAEAEISKLEAQHGALPATVEQITPRGRHLLFRWPPNGDIRNSASKIARGVDVRGEGGYIVCAPSTHPTGKRYAWSVDSATCFASAPEWLLSMITAPAPIMMPITTDSDAADFGRLRLEKGCRNDTLTRIVGHFFARHVDPELVLAAALAIGKDCKPPLPSAEVTRIVNSIAGRELKGRMQ
jgi:hypothetical protein